MKIDHEVLGLLRRCHFSDLSLKLPDHLDRPMYIRANTVLEAAGGMWNRKAKAHIFKSNAYNIIESLRDSGEVTIPQDFGYFPTPPAIVEMLTRYLAGQI